MTFSATRRHPLPASPCRQGEEQSGGAPSSAQQEDEPCGGAPSPAQQGRAGLGSALDLPGDPAPPPPYLSLLAAESIPVPLYLLAA